MPLVFPASPNNSDKYELWAWNATNSTWDWDVVPAPSQNVEYLVIAGGGAGGGSVGVYEPGGGGGAGGYRCSVSGENTGEAQPAESPFLAVSGQSYTVTVGAGGTGVTSAGGTPDPGVGEPSVFATVTALGGGGGADYYTDGSNGGSGGGGAEDRPRGLGTSNQGTNGGTGVLATGGGTAASGGGGGGSAGVGANGGSGVGGTGGLPTTSSITGTPVARAGGGGGGATTPGAGGGGGAGAARLDNSGISADGNSGSGGGGSQSPNTAYSGGNGGSGVVILKYPLGRTLAIGVGLTSSTVIVGNFAVTTFTAGTDTVTFN